MFLDFATLGFHCCIRLVSDRSFDGLFIIWIRSAIYPFSFFFFQEEKTFFIDFSNALNFIFYQVFFCLFRIQSVGCFVVNSGSSLLILWNKLKKFRKYILNTSYS